MVATTADTTGFVAGLRPLAERHGVLRGPGPVVVARAPGRLDVMGGIADYSGSLVLELPLAAATHVAARGRPDRRLRAVSVGERTRVAELDLDAFLAAAGEGAVREFVDRAAVGWVAYAFGIVALLAAERGVAFEHGLDLLISSTVPEGAGLASSAALEVASSSAIAALAGARLAPLELALLCQRVENEIVGAPCGAMDQITACCGEDGRLLRLLCRPATIEGQLAIPAGWSLVGVDSGQRHSVAGDPYGDARVGAFIGKRLLADRGVAVRYLAEVGPEAWRAHRDALPERIDGAEFVERFGGIDDRVTRVEPGRCYPVRAPAAHGVMEQQRAAAFARTVPWLATAALAGVADDAVAAMLGSMMYGSHESYSACGLGSPATDVLVASLREAGPARGVFGARVTGGGSGGTVAVLARTSALPLVRELARSHAESFGGGAVFAGSSPGAAAHGVVTVEELP